MNASGWNVYPACQLLTASGRGRPQSDPFSAGFHALNVFHTKCYTLDIRSLSLL